MTRTTRKLSTVFAGVAVLTSLFADRLLAAQNDAEDVRKVVAGFATAWNHHGVVPANSPGFSEEDRRHYGIFKNSTLTFDGIDVRLLRKEIAIAHVNWELLGDDRTQTSRHGLFIFVLARQNGGWLIASAQNTEINRAVK